MSGKIAKIKLGNTIFSVSDNRLDKYENGFSAASAGTMPSKKADGTIEWKSIVIPQTSWGNITGTLSNQADLFNALSGKANSSHTHTKSEITDFSHNHDERYYTEDEIDSKLNSKLNSSLKGANNGIAELDSIGKVPSSQLPSYVDDVLEFNSQSNFPSTGETGKIYIAKDTNKTYRWSGTNYVEISTSLALGETSSTAYRGDRGKIAYDHSQTSHAPSNAEVNQNAFSNIKVGSTTVSADSKTDTLELIAGTNVTLTPDATNDKVIITAKDTTYGVATSSVLGLIKSGTDITVDSSGNVSVNDDSHNHIISNIDGLQNVLDGKLSKTTYEYNKELALGSSGKVCIGVFPCYDSNISVEIKSTTNITYNGTLIIATQNINTSLGGTYTATVYGDENNTLTSAIKIQYLSGSNAFSVYINLPPWSKNLLHIQCVSLAGTPSSIATIVDTIPSTATIIPTNAFSHTHTVTSTVTNETLTLALS